MEVHRARIAPTPSGFLHAGNAVNFLVAAALAARHGARLRLRIDDLDAERKRPEYMEDIFASLAWLGIVWHDGPRNAQDQERSFSQQRRIPVYMEHIGLLKEQGDLYACLCSRSAAVKGCDCRLKGVPFNDEQAGWRLHLPHDALVRMHGPFGEIALLQPARLMPDPVIRQRTALGGRPSYQIASLVDDVEHGIDLVVRGEDLLASTACQLYMAERLGLASFGTGRFMHHPLLPDADGRKLSKSRGAASLRAMRERGESPEALHAKAKEMLAGLGGGQSTP